MKGTASQGKKSKHKSHIACRKCGKISYHVKKKTCASCGYGTSPRIRTYSWAKKHSA